MAKPRNFEMEARIKALWAAGERNKTRIAEAIPCSRAAVTMALARTDGPEPGKEYETAAQKIARLWKTTEFSRHQIQSRVNCSREYVDRIVDGMPRETGRVCRNNKITGEGITECGGRLHVLPCGHVLGCCKECWDTLKPISGQKSVINGQRASRRYG